MNFGMFSVMTILGAGLWCSVLAFLGSQVYKTEPGLFDPQDPERMVRYIKGHSLWIVFSALVLGALYFLMLKLTEKKPEQVA